ncbi:unnamed protein product [Paramecium pentaurelia]|uniref:Transmembrane protein n=1 Tax=Paramecium pentaurelia TaxID=43138 RepID=A0A8S1WNX2_9CILI|nr:unnamed protein product [Paramecium pentaurelia]
MQFMLFKTDQCLLLEISIFTKHLMKLSINFIYIKNQDKIQSSLTNLLIMKRKVWLSEKFYQQIILKLKQFIQNNDAIRDTSNLRNFYGDEGFFKTDIQGYVYKAQRMTQNIGEIKIQYQQEGIHANVKELVEKTNQNANQDQKNSTSIQPECKYNYTMMYQILTKEDSVIQLQAKMSTYLKNQIKKLNHLKEYFLSQPLHYQVIIYYKHSNLDYQSIFIKILIYIKNELIQILCKKSQFCEMLTLKGKHCQLIYFNHLFLTTISSYDHYLSHNYQYYFLTLFLTVILKVYLLTKIFVTIFILLYKLFIFILKSRYKSIHFNISFISKNFLSQNYFSFSHIKASLFYNYILCLPIAIPIYQFQYWKIEQIENFTNKQSCYLIKFLSHTILHIQLNKFSNLFNIIETLIKQQQMYQIIQFQSKYLDLQLSTLD